MLAHDTILVKLPYPTKFLTFRRVIGFSFTNMYLYLFRDAEGFKTSVDYTNWVKTHGQSSLIQESLYHAARAYCLLNKKKENFTKDGLRKAIALASVEDQHRIMKCWSASESFGATVKESKKKTMTRSTIPKNMNFA